MRQKWLIALYVGVPLAVILIGHGLKPHLSPFLWGQPTNTAFDSEEASVASLIAAPPQREADREVLMTNPFVETGDRAAVTVCLNFLSTIYALLAGNPQLETRDLFRVKDLLELCRGILRESFGPGPERCQEQIQNIQEAINRTTPDIERAKALLLDSLRTCSP
jgi:hypothetical protein